MVKITSTYLHRYTPLEPSGESSSSTTDVSEDDYESIDDRLPPKTSHNERGEKKIKVNLPFSSEHDRNISAKN